jgi:hypothetical protein
MRSSTTCGVRIEELMELAPLVIVNAYNGSTVDLDQVAVN